MLVFSRQQDQGLTIFAGGEEIHICVVEIRGNKARIGVTAPDQFACHRDEIVQAIRAGGQDPSIPVHKLREPRETARTEGASSETHNPAKQAG